MNKIVPIPASLQIQSHLVQWGNDLGIRITHPLAKISGMTADSRVTVTAKPGRIIIETTPKRVTLEEMLAKFDPVRHGGEYMAFASTGRRFCNASSHTEVTRVKVLRPDHQKHGCPLSRP